MEKNPRQQRVSLLVPREQAARADVPQREHHLFGGTYDRIDEKGARINERDLPQAVQKRIRKVFTQTILLRNAHGGAAS